MLALSLVFQFSPRRYLSKFLPFLFIIDIFKRNKIVNYKKNQKTQKKENNPLGH